MTSIGGAACAGTTATGTGAVRGATAPLATPFCTAAVNACDAARIRAISQSR